MKAAMNIAYQDLVIATDVEQAADMSTLNIQVGQTWRHPLAPLIRLFS
jgi:hypothetical protein